MGSSVAIDDDLRKRLKILVAKYDTTQAEIIKRVLDLFENKKKDFYYEISPKILNELQNASTQVLKSKTRRKKVMNAFKKPGIDIDDLRMEFHS